MNKKAVIVDSINKKRDINHLRKKNEIMEPIFNV